MRLSSGGGVRRCRPALSLRGPSGRHRTAPQACGAMDCGLRLRFRSYPGVELVTRSPVLDAAGRRRSPATMPGFHAGRPPRNKGPRYPADPPTVEEIVAVMRIAGDGLHGRRLRGLLVVLWRAGLRIDEALSLREADLDRRRGSLLVRRGKGGRRREVGTPHHLRHAHAVEMAREGVPLIVIQRHWPQPPRDHLGLPARHRQRRNH
jgi:Phage integrase family